MKTYRSSSWNQTFTCTRANAIKKAIAFLKDNRPAGIAGARFTWRAEDESGFTIKVEMWGEVKLMHKWNAARN